MSAYNRHMCSFSDGNLKPQDYIVKIARSSEEAKQLLKVGFEYVNEINGEYLYTKARIG